MDKLELGPTLGLLLFPLYMAAFCYKLELNTNEPSFIPAAFVC